MQISIKSARVNKELTQSEVAKALGVSKKTVFSWEKYITKPSADMVGKICDLYEMDYDNIRWNG